MDGVLSLTFGVNAQGLTCLREQSHRPPLQVVRAFRQPDGGVLTHLHNVSGGVLGGDRLTQEFTLDAGAQVQLTTTSATRIYRAREGDAEALQTTRIQVGPNGILEYLPDTTIPFGGARYRQDTTIDLSDNAGLFWWETLAPGRAAQGEIFAYESVILRAAIRANGREIAAEHLRLEPARAPLASSARLGPYRYFTTFYACRVGATVSQLRQLETDLHEIAASRTPPGVDVWGVSTLSAHGVCIRGLSVRGLHIAADLYAFWDCARRALYGAGAVAPRKIN
ncbi:urease accessory protein UreD [Capsulimonas corticalis]|uniref:Urease accessory protein UreD n=1 Tax=Capsulimonas corticalis TaxID=2219043 RepID=A0A402D6N2_9BACT|nr:urease accessory protein UreD [Capsulimonas corticalis]